MNSESLDWKIKINNNYANYYGYWFSLGLAWVLQIAIAIKPDGEDFNLYL